MSGNRLITSAEILKKHGASHVYACATHAVLSGNMERLQASEVRESMTEITRWIIQPTKC